MSFAHRPWHPLAALVLAALVLLPAASGAPRAGETPRPRGADTGEITIGAPRSLTFFPLSAARELGYFGEEGVTVIFADLAVGAALRALEEGRVDLAAGFAAGPFESLRRGVRVQHVMALQDRTPAVLAARRDAGIGPGEVAALRGRRVGSPPRTGGLDLALRAVLEAAGLRPGRDVRIAPLAPTEILAALQAGRVDAAMLPSDQAAQAIERRQFAAAVVDLRRGEGPPAARAVGFPALLGTREGVTRRREAVGRAVRAVARAQRRLRQDPDLAAQVAERVFPGMDPQVVRAVLEAETAAYHPGVSREAVRHLVSALRAAGRLGAGVAYEAVVATAFVPRWSE